MRFRGRNDLPRSGQPVRDVRGQVSSLPKLRNVLLRNKNGESGTGDNNTPDSADPSSRVQRRRMEKPALMRERQTERSRMITIRLPPKMRQASMTTNSSYHQTPPNKSASNAGF